MGFIVNYADISKRPTKIPSPDPDSSHATLAQATSNLDVELVYHIQVDMTNTGQGYISQDDLKEKFSLLAQKERSIASFTLKVNRKNLTNEIRSNEQRELIAEKIKAYILKGKHEIKSVDKSTHSYTNIPCFDIHFENLFINNLDYEQNEFQEGEPQETDNKEEKEVEKFDVPPMTLEYVNDHMSVVREYFGLNDTFKNIQMITNQSMRSLEFIFPEMQEETINKESLEIATYGQKKTVLDKSKETSLRHNVKVFMLEKDGYDKEALETMVEGSHCLNTCLKKHLGDQIPGYITAPGWQLLYQKSRDGRSYNT